MNKILKLTTAAGSILILLAVIIISLVIYFNQQATSVNGLTPTSSEPTIVKPTAIYGYPKRLLIPSLNMDLQVIPGEYNPNTHAWTLTRDKVQYAVMTAQPNNDNGNTLIYGHYRREVFSRLRFVAPDAEAIVITDNGYKFVYKFKSFKVVQPSDGTIFKYKGKPQLTLQTCTGVFFQNRQLFDFDFVRYEKV